VWPTGMENRMGPGRTPRRRGLLREQLPERVVCDTMAEELVLGRSYLPARASVSTRTRLCPPGGRVGASSFYVGNGVRARWVKAYLSTPHG